LRSDLCLNFYLKFLFLSEKRFSPFFLIIVMVKSNISTQFSILASGCLRYSRKFFSYNSIDFMPSQSLDLGSNWGSLSFSMTGIFSPNSSLNSLGMPDAYKMRCNWYCHSIGNRNNYSTKSILSECAIMSTKVLNFYNLFRIMSCGG
jgi:hypothetical protein